MEKAYFLNSYVNELEENQKASLQADSYLQNYLTRTNGVKTIEELKKEVEIFLEQNNVDSELKSELVGICDSINQESDLYISSLKLENAVKDYVYEKNKSLESANQEVEEIKSNLIQDNINKLDEVGVHISGDTQEIKDSIKNEDDVYHFEINVDKAVDYYRERNDMYNNPTVTETTTTTLENAIEKSGDIQVLSSVLSEEKQEVKSNSSVDVKEDGTVQINALGTNFEDMNFVFMMTTLLVANNPNFSLNTNMDMKFIKEKDTVDNFKVIYGHFPISPNGSQIDPALEKQIYDLANGYDSNVSYSELLNMTSPELRMALQLIEENVLEQTGEFKMAVKPNGSGYDIKMGIDDDFKALIDAFYENGAFTTEGIDGTVVVMIPNNMEQIVLLDAILETLKQKGYTEEQVNNLTNQYQKKLVYKNEDANIPLNLLIIITIVCTMEIIGLLYFLMK